MFSVLNSRLIRPLPVPDAAHLVRITAVDRGNNDIRLSMPDALDMAHTLRGFAFYRDNIFNLGAASRPEIVRVLETSTNLFSVMGVKVSQGRPFLAVANQPGQRCEAVLSWPFWMRQFGGRHVIGNTIRLNEKPCLITGVLPENLDLPLTPSAVEIWVPAVFDLHDPNNGRRVQSWYGIAHLGPNVSLPAFNAQLASLSKRLSRENPIDDAALKLHGVRLRDWLTAGVKDSVILLFAATVGVLLMACANVANLMLTKGALRTREMSVRAAIGATRWMLLQQLLTESLLLAAVSALSAMTLTSVAVRVIGALPDSNLPPQTIHIDWRVNLFAIVCAAITGLLSGAMPAVRLSMTSLAVALKQSDGRITEARRQQAIRQLLIGLETAIATMLLIASLFLLHSFQAVSHIPLGFQSDHLLTAYLSLPVDRYGKNSADLARLAESVTTQLDAAPGIQSTAFSTNVPLQSTSGSAPVQIEGRPVPLREADAPLVLDNGVSPTFRRTMNIPLLAGRDLDERDNTLNATAVLVNAAFAVFYFPGESAVGKRLRYNPVNDPDAPLQQIAGVIGDARQDGLEAAVQPEIFIPLARSMILFPAVIIRTADDPASHLRDIVKAVHQIDPEIPVFSARTMQQVESRRLGSRTFTTSLVAGFACAALLLAAGGIFAVIAYSVSQRTPEIGLRIACGATPSRITWMIIRQGVTPAFAGIAAGAISSYVLSRYLASLLYGVKPADIGEYLEAVVLLASISALSALWPARRASSIEPWTALRYE